MTKAKTESANARGANRAREALARLDAAVARLEAAAGALGTNVAESRVHTKLNAGLTEALHATQAEYTALRETTRKVSERLDATIVRLRGAIEG